LKKKKTLKVDAFTENGTIKTKGSNCAVFNWAFWGG